MQCFPVVPSFLCWICPPVTSQFPLINIPYFYLLLFLGLPQELLSALSACIVNSYYSTEKDRMESSCCELPLSLPCMDSLETCCVSSWQWQSPECRCFSACAGMAGAYAGAHQLLPSRRPCADMMDVSWVVSWWAAPSLWILLPRLKKNHVNQTSYNGIIKSPFAFPAALWLLLN